MNSVKLHQNVELMLCRETNMYKPLDEDFMMPTGKDPISQIYFTQSWRQNALEYIEKTQPTHVSIWDWYCIAAGKQTWQNVPWVQGEVAIRNQKLYEELGAEYVYYDHGPTDGYFEPNTVETFVLRWPLWYVAAKASFDGSLDEKEILGDACDKLFGDASELMLQYFVKMSDVSKEKAKHVKIQNMRKTRIFRRRSEKAVCSHREITAIIQNIFLADRIIRQQKTAFNHVDKIQFCIRFQHVKKVFVL